MMIGGLLLLGLPSNHQLIPSVAPASVSHTFTVPPSVPWRVIMKSQDNDNGAMVAGGNGVIVPTKHGQQFYLLNLVHLAASFFLVFTAFSGIQVSLRILRLNSAAPGSPLICVRLVCDRISPVAS